VTSGRRQTYAGIVLRQPSCRSLKRSMSLLRRSQHSTASCEIMLDCDRRSLEGPPHAHNEHPSKPTWRWPLGASVAFPNVAAQRRRKAASARFSSKLIPMTQIRTQVSSGFRRDRSIRLRRQGWRNSRRACRHGTGDLPRRAPEVPGSPAATARRLSVFRRVPSTG